jgi:hypothetical protein
MSLTAIVIAVLAVAGIIWAYPKLPYPWNYVVLAVVVVICLWALLNLAGMPITLRP